MKTIFTEQEIIDFVRKLNNQLRGESILYDVEHNTPPEVTSIMDAFSHIKKLGVKEGEMNAKMNMIENLCDFFQIDK